MSRVQYCRRAINKHTGRVNMRIPSGMGTPKDVVTGTADPHTRRTSGPISAIKHHGTPVERIVQRKSGNHRVLRPPALRMKTALRNVLNVTTPPPPGNFCFPLPRAFLGGEEKDGGEGKGDGRHQRWQCGAGGSTRVESRESGYFCQIIGTCSMFSVCRRSSAGALEWMAVFSSIYPSTTS